MNCVSENVISLYNSSICRLCGEESKNGYPLFCEKKDNQDFSVFINKYLPIKIVDDGKYPRWICGSCYLQVEATVQFFNLIELGQKTLNELYELRNEEDRIRNMNNETPTILSNNNKNNLNIISQNLHLSIKNSQLNGEQKLISLLKINNLNSIKRTSQVSLLDIEKINKSLKNHGNIKRKRGRPKKSSGNIQNSLSTVSSSSPLNNTVDEPTVDNEMKLNEEIITKRRSIKPPSRYSEAIYGKEYEKVYSEMENKGNLSEKYDDDGCSDDDDDIIGFVQSQNGESLGDLIVTSNKKTLSDKINYENRKMISSNIKQKTIFMCDVCKISFSHENKFLQHRLSHKNVRYECNECLNTFTNKNLLIDHQTKENHYGAGIIEEFNDSQKSNVESSSNIDEIKMGMLSNQNTLQSALNNVEMLLSKDTQNLTSLNDQQQYMNQIDESQNDKSDAGNHINLINFSSKADYNANFSSNNYQTFIVPNTETINSKKDKNYKCKLCDDDNLNFHSQSSLYSHMKNYHNDGRTYACSKCNKQFSSKQRLKSHQLTHISTKPFKCQTCGKEFKIKSVFIAHKSLHTGDKKFSCETCGQKFAHKRSLKLHKFIHEDKKPFECELCGKCFTQYGNMQEHYRIHTGERPFKCHICDKTFRASSQCRTHIKRHQVERPLKCTKCDKRFVNNEELQMHLRRHNNIKPFVCTECNKGFVALQALKKHYRTHTGEKPYSCRMCNRRFSDRSNLRKHHILHMKKQQKNNLNIMNDVTIDNETSNLENNLEEEDEEVHNDGIDSVDDIDGLDDATLDGIQTMNCTDNESEIM